MLACRIYSLVLVFFSFFLFSDPAFATKAEPIPLRVGLHTEAPFVMQEQDGVFTGMAVELWETIASKLHLKTEYVLYNDISDLLHDAANNEVDLIVDSLTVTADRAKMLTFSYPWYDSGLRILIHPESRSKSIWTALKNFGHAEKYIGVLLLFIALTVIVTLVRKRIDPQCPTSHLAAFASSLHDLVFLAKSGNLRSDYLGWVGHLLAVIWMIFGVAVIAFITSGITAAMTTIAMTHDIASFKDLPGKRVATIAASAEENYLRDLGIHSISYAHAEDAAKALINGQVDAFVCDAPVLEYWANSNSESNTQVVGPLVHPSKFAFATSPGNIALMEKISREIITLQDEGVIDNLRQKYVGRFHP